MPIVPGPAARKWSGRTRMRDLSRVQDLSSNYCNCSTQTMVRVESAQNHICQYMAIMFRRSAPLVLRWQPGGPRSKIVAWKSCFLSPASKLSKRSACGLFAAHCLFILLGHVKGMDVNFGIRLWKQESSERNGVSSKLQIGLKIWRPVFACSHFPEH